MELNDSKAGMEGLDKDRINAVIEEASRGSKFYAAKTRAQERISRRVSQSLLVVVVFRFPDGLCTLLTGKWRT